VAIRSGYSVPIGVYFRPWGWGRQPHRPGAATGVIITTGRGMRVRANAIDLRTPYAVPRYAVPRPPEPHPRRRAVRARARTGAHGERSREEHRKEEKRRKPDGQ